MARALFAQTPVTLSGVAAIDFFATSEHPNVVDGNEVTHNGKMFFGVRNNHDAKYISFQPQMKRTLKEGKSTVELEQPAAVNVAFGTTRFFGPYTAANFKDPETGRIEINWAFEGGGDIVVADVDVALIVHP